jgi:hypothetical protein
LVREGYGQVAQAVEVKTVEVDKEPWKLNRCKHKIIAIMGQWISGRGATQRLEARYYGRALNGCHCSISLAFLSTACEGECQ